MNFLLNLRLQLQIRPRLLHVLQLVATDFDAVDGDVVGLTMQDWLREMEKKDGSQLRDWFHYHHVRMSALRCYQWKMVMLSAPSEVRSDEYEMNDFVGWDGVTAPLVADAVVVNDEMAKTAEIKEEFEETLKMAENSLVK